MRLSVPCGLALVVAVGVLVVNARTSSAADCNGNGIEDALDLSSRSLEFGETPSYQVGCGNAGSLIVADLNGDGNPDLVTGDSVLLNKGDGKFANAVEYAAWAVYPNAADFNGDGSPDLAVVGTDGCPQCVSVLITQGDGTFKAGVSYLVGDLPALVIAIDLNGDGKPDLATPNRLSNDVSVLLNRGDGTFKDSVNYRVGSSPSSLVAADLNGDKMPDLATGNVYGMCPTSADISVLLNLGDGTFSEAVTYLTGRLQADFRISLIAADLNGDGILDVAIWTELYNVPLTCRGNGNTGITVLLNRGNGTFNDDAHGYRVGFSNYLTITAVDLNGDQMLDLATPNYDVSGVSVLLNQGGGIFGDTVSFPVREVPGSLIAADLNGDKMPDFAVTSNGDSVHVLLNRTTPPISLDLNHNGQPDECEIRFHRGDPNSSGTTDLSDAITIFGFLFLGEPPALACKESADSNNDGTIDLSDGIYLLNYRFLGGLAPASPGPSTSPCGLDPDPPGSPGDLGCDAYSC